MPGARRETIAAGVLRFKEPAMACAPCSKARAATISAIRHVATGDLASARLEAAKACAAIAAKAESMRVRMATVRKA